MRKLLAWLGYAVLGLAGLLFIVSEALLSAGSEPGDESDDESQWKSAGDFPVQK